MVKDPLAMQQVQEMGVNPWLGKILEEAIATHTTVCLPGKFHSQRSLAGYSPWVCKESDMTQ